MAQYIDKDALVEYIKFRYLEHQTGNQPIGCLDRMNEDKEILSYLNTLEVKEVDVEKEIQAFAKIELEPIKIYDTNVSITITMHQLYQCAKHFFELGLKAQKGE